MSQNTEAILADIEKTKADLSENILYLEDHLKQKVEDVKQKVEDAKAKVKELSPVQQVQRHPLAGVGVALGAGILVGSWLAKSATKTVAQRGVGSLLGTNLGGIIGSLALSYVAGKLKDGLGDKLFGEVPSQTINQQELSQVD